MMQKQDTAPKAFTLRFEPGVSEELNELSELLNMSKNKLVNDLIRQEYSRAIDGDPKVKEAIEKLNLFRKMLEELGETK